MKVRRLMRLSQLPLILKTHASFSVPECRTLCGRYEPARFFNTVEDERLFLFTYSCTSPPPEHLPPYELQREV